MTQADAAMLVNYQKENGGFPLERIEVLLASIATLLRMQMGNKNARITDLMPSAQNQLSSLDEFLED